VVAGAAGRTFAKLGSGSLKPKPGDRRFSDAAWTRNPWFFGVQQAYLAWADFAGGLVEASDLEERTKERAAYVADLWLDAVAPTNFLWGNPGAQRRAVETAGASLVAGFQNFLHDVAENGGRPSQVDTSPFKLGKNLAATPGKVVFRNELMELIQYAPQTDTVHEVPLLLSPPWINKYYIMDLAPGRSFAEWAVRQGHTVFAISYRNPDESMRDVALDDYLVHGPGTALDVIADITGAPKANIVGLCLGGTITTMLLAYLAAGGEDRVQSATLLNTMIDFSEPGPMGWFLDQESVRRLDARMLERGYLDAREMSGMFDLLRPRDLIWNYVVSGWLMGEKPPAFDILAWNGDGTRMPAEMHSFYLRYCYGENQLARDEMTLAGRQLRLGAITADTYLLSAQEDHIAPWRSAYAGGRLLGGAPRFVLSSSGHVAGIVNPPGPSKRRYWTNDALPSSADEWLAAAQEHAGSWWEDWSAWIAGRAGARVAPPPMGSSAYPPVEDAPGTYVHEK
jgi:polyhydroxyalkanoate synthase